MTTKGPKPVDSALVWDEDGLPRSSLYGDVYFSSDDGLAESRAVFLTGCDLPDAWRGSGRFTVGETGFGTGLNIAALLELWARTRPPGGRLRIFSIEAHPIAREDAARALGRWPEVADAAGALLAGWPRRAHGFHRLDLPGFDAVLDLAVMEAGEALAGWDGRADAWFLDGFAPASNPAMWRQDVLNLIAARSAPGARLATFTVAGAVRRGLGAAGFAVDKRPGFGRKRERLEARAPGEPAAERRLAPSVAIIGAGIAGAALARAFRALGAEAVVLDPRGPGGGASGNPAGLVTPRLDAGLGPTARLYAQAFARAVDLYGETPAAIISRGALQLEAGPRDARRFDTIAASEMFESGALARLSAEQAARRLGEPAAGALELAEALVLEPAVILRRWLGEVRREAAARITAREDGRWSVLGAAGEILVTADIVCLAAGPACGDLATIPPLQPIRGQASWVEGGGLPVAAAWGGYAIPTRTGVLFGATHDRDRTDEDVSAADDGRNLDLLAGGLPVLAGGLAGAILSSRASIRAATADRLPLAGPVPGAAGGLFVLAGLGSRGLCAAPLLAEHVAARALGAASPLPGDLAAIVDPDRFAIRAGRRASS